MSNARYEYDFEGDHEYRGDLEPGYREIREALRELGVEDYQ